MESWQNDPWRTYHDGSRELMFGNTDTQLVNQLPGYVSPYNTGQGTFYDGSVDPENRNPWVDTNAGRFIEDSGYSRQYAHDGSDNLSRLIDGSGAQVGDSYRYRVIPDDNFGLAFLAASGVAGLAAAGAGAGAGAAAGAGGGGAGALGSGVGYAVPGATAGGSGGLLGGAAGAAGGIGSAGGGAAAGGLMSGIGDYAGWAQLAAPILGAVVGAKGTDATQTVQNQIDPRIAQYLYGIDGKGGLLGNTSRLYDQQMATGGLNALQTQGIEQQRQALTDPRFTQGYEQMRALGGGLLGGPMAGNPYSQGRELPPAFNLGLLGRAP